jgi:hypothetical protein
VQFGEVQETQRGAIEDFVPFFFCSLLCFFFFFDKFLFTPLFLIENGRGERTCV